METNAEYNVRLVTAAEAIQALKVLAKSSKEITFKQAQNTSNTKGKSIARPLSISRSSVTPDTNWDSLQIGDYVRIAEVFQPEVPDGPCLNLTRLEKIYPQQIEEFVHHYRSLFNLLHSVDMDKLQAELNTLAQDDLAIIWERHSNMVNLFKDKKLRAKMEQAWFNWK